MYDKFIAFIYVLQKNESESSPNRRLPTVCSMTTLGCFLCVWDANYAVQNKQDWNISRVMIRRYRA